MSIEPLLKENPNRYTTFPIEWPDIWDDWRSLKCPTLIVRGRQSSVLDHEAAVRMREAIPRVRLAELEGSGHWIHQEVPGAFETTVRWFLDSPPQ